jgi:uracil-DNA glycosylase family 4
MSLNKLQKTIIRCTRCPRLVAHRKQVAQDKVRRFQHETYWGKPVPSFGDAQARLLLIGLAPAAHGANRTGRAFTGDRSGAWLYDALHTYGFASQPASEHRGDGLQLRDCYITQVLHCAPPGNKPARDEMAQCQSYMLTELALLPHLQVVVPLGKIAFDAYVRAGQHLDIFPGPKPRFGHGLRYTLHNGLTLMPSYHPSQQNTQTGRLTRAMFHDIFATVRQLLSSGTRHQPKTDLTTSPQQR